MIWIFYLVYVEILLIFGTFPTKIEVDLSKFGIHSCFVYKAVLACHSKVFHSKFRDKIIKSEILCNSEEEIPKRIASNYKERLARKNILSNSDFQSITILIFIACLKFFDRILRTFYGSYFRESSKILRGFRFGRVVVSHELFIKYFKIQQEWEKIYSFERLL